MTARDRGPNGPPVAALSAGQTGRRAHHEITGGKG